MTLRRVSTTFTNSTTRPSIVVTLGGVSAGCPLDVVLVASPGASLRGASGRWAGCRVSKIVLSTDAYVYLNIDDPVCAWATYRGVLVSVSPNSGEDDLIGGISVMSAAMMRAGSRARLNNELLIETVRRLRHPGRVSRLRGMYCFLDAESAMRAAALWGSFRNHFRPDFLAELHLETTSRRDRLDSNWITCARRDENGFLLPGELNQFDRYWQGEEYPGKVPIWETIIEGRMNVLGTDLRDRAYETIKRQYPRSVTFLEIARLAAWVGSDLGNLRAWLQDDGVNVSLRYLMDMRDANDPKFLRKLEQLKSEGHPINWADLHQEIKHGSFGQTIDLRPYGFTRPKSELPFLRQAPASGEDATMTPPRDNMRIAGRLSALENLLALLIFDRARVDANPLGWVTQYISSLRRGGQFIAPQPLPEGAAARLAEETHKAILEFADMLEVQLQELIRTGQIARPPTDQDSSKG
jgi:hypothetical protein